MSDAAFLKILIFVRYLQLFLYKIHINGGRNFKMF